MFENVEHAMLKITLEWALSFS